MSEQLELAQEQLPGLLNVETGELLEPTIDNAAAALIACRNMRERIHGITNEITAYAVSLAEERGTKTLHGERETLSVSGGLTEEYDAVILEDLLRTAGCPEDRIRAAITEEISYKVNKSVLKQLAGANPNYKTAIELARSEVEKPYRAAVKTKRGET
jgi:hypothetical protein